MRKKIMLAIVCCLFAVILSGCCEVIYYDYMSTSGELTSKIVVAIDDTYADCGYAYMYAKEMVQTILAEEKNIDVEYDDENYTIIITDYYANLTDYYIENEISGDEINEEYPTEIRSGFMVLRTYEQPIIFEQYHEIISAIDINNKFPWIEDNSSPPVLKYVYGRQYKNIASNCTLDVAYVDGYYEHIWVTDLDNYRNVKTQITYKEPYAPLWYGVSIAGSIVLTVIAVCIKKLTKNNDTNQ